jgi:hypothetical protein
MEKYTYEILAIDPTGDSGITIESNFIKAISFSEKLWEDSEEKPDNGTICDKSKNITLQAQKVDISQNLTDYISDSAFMINITSANFENLAKFRYDFLIHIKSLKFTNLWILTDDISRSISCKIYPLLNLVESSLRRYLIKFFIQKVGLNWLDVTVPKTVMEKITNRLRKEHFYSLVESRLTCGVDFDVLGEVIYKQTSGFNNPDKILEKINKIRSIEELDVLKSELQTNYTKYFKSAFQDNLFEKKWKQFFEIRNKTAHNHWFTIQDLEIAETLSSEILEIIRNAEDKIQEFSFSIEDKEAFRNATIEVAQQNEEEAIDEELMATPKIIGTMDLENGASFQRTNIVSEDVILELLGEQEKYRSKVGKSVGLKHFVTKYRTPLLVS